MFRSNLIKIISSLSIAVLFASCGSTAVNNDKYSYSAAQITEIDSYEINSNRHTRACEITAVPDRLSLDGYEIKLENDQLQVWFNSSLDSIRLVDKANNYVWGCLKGEEGEGLNQGWNNFANSICSIEYFNESGTETRLSLSDRNVKTVYDWEDNVLNCRFNAKKADISFSFTMQLDENALCFKMDDESIEETGTAKLKSVTFVPFLGNSYQDEINGYIFIPDGCGALIRFNNSSSYITGFDSKVYGLDGSIDLLTPTGTLLSNRINEYLVPENSITLPVFGISHGNKQNAFLAVIENGEEYSSIKASPAGVITDYNWASVYFNYRQRYTKTVSDTGIPIVQNKPNNISPEIKYYFLNGNDADYSGMANTYRKQLIEKGVLKKERKDKNIPLHLEILGATVKKGMLFKSVKTLTTAEQAMNIVNDLNEDGIDNITLVYRGWQKGAIEKSDYGKLKAGSNIGGKSALSKLRENILNVGSRMYLYLDPIMVNEEQIYKSSDTAIGISGSFISKISANPNKLYPTEFLAKISKVDEYVSKNYDSYCFAYDNLGDNLYSDYTKNHNYNRSDTIKSITKALSEHDYNGLYDPNLYCLKYTSDYFNIPVNNSQYQFETDTVPFLQIVLKGSIDYYSEFANQGYCSQGTVLKMIEYGVYPAFIVMQADNYQLTDTAVDDLFSLCFYDWRAEIGHIYNQVNTALAEVEGSYIIEHTAMSEGVVMVTYSNNKKIYINYLSEKVLVDGIELSPQSFCVL